jgi:hypothetical protein
VPCVGGKLPAHETPDLVGHTAFPVGPAYGTDAGDGTGCRRQPAGHPGCASSRTLDGMFLIIVGLMADRVRLSRSASGVCVGLLLFGTFGNWITTAIAGVIGGKPGDADCWRWASCRPGCRAVHPDHAGQCGLRNDRGRRDFAVRATLRVIGQSTIRASLQPKL